MTQEAPQIPSILRAPGRPVGRENGGSQPEEGAKYVTWFEVPELVENKFNQLVQELKDIEGEKAELEKRSQHARDEILRLVKNQPLPIRACGYQSRWVPPSTLRKLDRRLLVQAGVTPSQLEAGTAETPKSGYLEVRKVKDGE